MSLDTEHKEFARLIARHQRAVQSYIFANIPNWDDCDEVWQETSVRLWLEFDKFEPGSNFAAWAIRVAYFEILTWRKKVGRSRLLSNQDLIEAIASQQDRFTSEPSQARLKALDHCLENLNSRNREFLGRFYAPNMQIQSVASSMGVSVDAAYKAVQRIRKLLRQCIEKRVGDNLTP